MSSSRDGYDEVAYPSYPYSQTHPDRLATVAGLFGMNPADIDHCRVLELGCAGGGNLLSVISQGRQDEEGRGVWQLRFGEHTLDDEEDFERHFDYIHYNAVKHKYVHCPHQWPHSSFHRWVKANVYPWHWACWDDARHVLDFKDLAGSVGE